MILPIGMPYYISYQNDLTYWHVYDIEPKMINPCVCRHDEGSINVNIKSVGSRVPDGQFDSLSIGIE